MNTPTLRTKRLILRKFTEADLSAVYEIFSDLDVETNENFDLGYGLRSEFQHRGIVTEAGKAVIKQLKKDGIPFVTATHDVNNPKSGEVMKRLGMMYQYSYKEQWQPKGFPVIFRMYQLNLDENKNRVYKKYWNDSMVHFVEENV